MSAPETCVYQTNEYGDIRSVPGWGSGALHWVAGGSGMTDHEGVIDLARRLMTDSLLTPEQSRMEESAMWEQDMDTFTRYIEPKNRAN